MATGLLGNLYNSNPLIRDNSGTLGTTSIEEASKRAGLPASPTTPVGASTLGVNPDSAKMTGSSAQKTNALRQSIKEGSSLQDYLRRQQGRQTATQAEQEEMKRAKQFAMFGRLDEITDKLATRALTGDDTLLKQVPLLTDSELKEKLPQGTDFAKTKPLIDKWASGTINSSELGELLKATGVATSAEQVAALAENPKQLNESLKNFLFKGSDEAIAKGIAGTIDAKQDLSVSALTEADLKELGFSSVDEMAAALRLDPKAVKELSIGDLNANFQSQFGDIEKLQQMAVDPRLSANERQQALTQLRALGAAGYRIAMESMDPIQKQVDAATTVNIPGIGDLSIQKLADNEAMAGLIKDAIQSGDFTKLPPGLQQWVTKNRQAVDGIISKVSARGEELAKVAKSNIDIINTIPDTSVAMKKLLFGDNFDQLTGSPVTIPPILDLYRKAPEGSQTRLAIQTLLTDKTIAELAPEMVKEVMKYTPQQLAAFGLDTQEGMQKLVNYYEIFSTIEGAAPESILTDYFGTQDVPALHRELVNQDSYGVLGPEGRSLLSLLDSDGDGKPDKPEQIKANLLNNWMKTDGKTPVPPSQVKDVTLPDSIQGMLGTARASVSTNEDFQTYKGWMVDGKIDEADINRTIREKNLSISDAASMVSRVQMPDGIRKSAMKSLENQAYNQLAADTKESTATTSLEQYDELIARLKTLAPMTEPEKAAVDRRIKELEKIRAGKEKADRELADRIARAEDVKLRNRAIANLGAPSKGRGGLVGK